MSATRRQFLHHTVHLGGLLSLGIAVDAVRAAQPVVVEIIAFAHPPVQSALQPLRQWLASQGGPLKVVEVDMETAEGARRLKAIGITSHVPVVVLVDGQYRHIRKDGSSVEFVSFPAGAGTPAGVKGRWSAEDVKAVIQARRP